jgi:hypothetical protein
LLINAVFGLFLFKIEVVAKYDATFEDILLDLSNQRKFIAYNAHYLFAGTLTNDNIAFGQQKAWPGLALAINCVASVRFIIKTMPRFNCVNIVKLIWTR